jgi:hypothetical protein
MMMFRVLVAVLSLVCMPSAESAQVSQIELSGAAASQSIQMMDQRFEPIYEQQPYQATCSQQVLDHMETVCSTVSDTVCHGVDRQVCTTQADQVCNSQGCTTVPRRVCHQEQRVCEVIPRRVCSERAVMRTDFYSCTKYQTVVVGQRLVKTFQHNVEVAIDRPELLQGQRLVISLLAREAAVSPTLVSSFTLNMLTVEQQTSRSDMGSQEMISTRIMVHVGASTVSIGKILSSSVQALSLNASSISMTIAGLAELSQDLAIGLKLSQKVLIGHKTLFQGTLDSSAVSVTQGDSVRVTIPLSNLNVEQLKSKKKHNLSVAIALKQPSLSILNTNDLSAILNKRLEASISNILPK